MNKPVLKTKWVTYFLKLCQEESGALAAQKLGISPQALYRNLDQLEQVLQVQLMQRDKHAFHLTAEGRLFLYEAQNVMQQMFELKHSLRQHMDAQLQGVISIAWRLSLSVFLLEEVMAAFMEKYAQVYTSVQRQPNQAQLEQQILEGRIDIAFSDSPPQQPQIDFALGPRFPCVIVSAPQRLQHWSAFSYVRLFSSDKPGQDLFWDEQLYPRQVICEADSVTPMFKWCIEGQAAACVPRILVLNELAKGQLQVVAQPPADFHSQLYIYTTSDSRAKPATQIFMDLIKQKSNTLYAD